MFEYTLLDRARADRRAHRAARGRPTSACCGRPTSLLRRGVAELTLLGPEDEVARRAPPRLGLDLDGARRRSTRPTRSCASASRPSTPSARAHKGVTVDAARDIVSDVSYFGTLMVALGAGRRDGLRRRAHHGGDDPAGVRARQDRARASRSCPACSSCAWPTACWSTATAPSTRTRPPSSSPTSRSPRRRPRRSSGSSRGWRCCRTRPASPAPARRSSGCARRPSWCASARPSCSVEGPIQYDAAVDAGVAATKLPGSRGRRARDGVHLPRPQHGQQHLQGGAAQRGRDRRSGRCCRGCASRSTTSRAARPCTTSSTPSRSPRSRRRQRERPFVVNCGSSSLKYRLVDVDSRRDASAVAGPIGSQTGSPDHTPQALCASVLADGARRVSTRASPSSRTASCTAASASPRPVLIDDAVRGRDRATWRCSRRCTTRPTLTGIEVAPASASRTCRTSPSSTPRSTTTLPPRAYTYAVPRAWRERAPLRLPRHLARVRLARRRPRARPRRRGRRRDRAAPRQRRAARARSPAGAAIDTSMGLTPLEGLVMGTRSGDVDPALVLHLRAHAPTCRPTRSTRVAELARAGCSALAGDNDMREVQRRVARGRRRGRARARRLLLPDPQVRRRLPRRARRRRRDRLHRGRGRERRPGAGALARRPGARSGSWSTRRQRLPRRAPRA